jgi:FKBP-type peptidyl-prolyl cis-trans isomerase SlyD
MKAANNTVVTFHYELSDEQGQKIESSREREALAVLLGAHNIIPGLEKAMLGRTSGERFQVSVPPAEAYGEHRPDFTQRVPKKYFRDAQKLKVGMQTMLQSADGPRMVTVAKLGQSVIDVDLNHPMAGKTLSFDIEITEVREASDEEKAHGHVHGPGGHHHG